MFRWITFCLNPNNFNPFVKEKNTINITKTVAVLSSRQGTLHKHHFHLRFVLFWRHNALLQCFLLHVYWPQTIFPPLLWADCQRSPSGCHLAWPRQRSPWLWAAYTLPCAEICLRHPHSVSAEMSSVQTLRANNAFCNRSSFEVLLNTCQDTSLLFFFGNFYLKQQDKKNNRSSFSPERPPRPTADRLISCCLGVFFRKEHQLPSR